METDNYFRHGPTKGTFKKSMRRLEATGIPLSIAANYDPSPVPSYAVVPITYRGAEIWRTTHSRLGPHKPS